MTPFEALYGRAPPPPTIAGYTNGSTAIASLEASLSQRAHALSLVKANLHRAQHRMVQQTNAHGRDRTFAEARIHQVFHVSLLKPCAGQPISQVCPLPVVPLGTTDSPPPLQLLDTRTANSGSVEALIHWEGQSADEASWVPLDDVAAFFPSLRLEDNAGLKTGGIVASDPKARPKRQLKRPARYI
ncbi:UNVERIFIED_CONTAM: hypothetical protein Sradi_3826700 [Sesamum radiatum]|uniref:Chromo domain-containing protein n=1 Tax=Sesamum radiatum TaxID=300843 RepID=A0AAW2Q117_SESRA